MKRITNFYPVLLAVVTCVVQVQAATYYVALYGNDSFSGSAEPPWGTISRAASAVSPGDTVNIGPGRYDESVSIATPGSPGAPVLFQGSPETVLLGNLTIAGSYVTVDGLTVSPPGGYSAVAIGGSYNTLRNAV